MSKILVIDDMSGIRQSLEVMLKALDHEVDLAQDGEEGLDMVKKGEYDVVITDIMMPKKDGVEVVMELKDTQNPPYIVAISGGGVRITSEDALEIPQQHADRVLKKPFTRTELKDILDELK